MILQNGKRIDGCTDTVPVGTLQPFLGLVPPKGYLACQGQMVSKITYSELYEICGDTFGVSTETHFYLPDLRGKTLAGYDENDAAMNTIGKLLGQKTHTHTSAAHTHTVAGHVHSTGNHTLTIDEVPAHNHQIYDNNRTTALATGGTEGTENAKMINGLPNSAYALGNDHILMARSDGSGGNGAHNHGNTGSTALTSDSTTPGATGSNTNYQPTITVNWIVKAVMLIPNYIIVEDRLDSDSVVDALSARQGKLLNEKFTDYATKSEMIQYLPLSGVINALTSTSTTNALSAAQGKVLNDTKQNVLEHGRVHADLFTEYTFGSDIQYCYYEYYFQQAYSDIPVVVCSTSNPLSKSYYGNVPAHVCEITKQKCVFILPVGKLNIYFNFIVLPA